MSIFFGERETKLIKTKLNVLIKDIIEIKNLY